MDNIPAGTLVVVADGGSARVFRNVGDPPELSLQQVDLLEVMNVNDEGPSGVQPGGNDGYQTDEATFARQLARRLNDGALQQRYAHVVLVADPRTLGEIRPQLHKEVHDRLIGEIDRDLTNVPLPDIERALS